jgi:hypothetical protein
VIDSWNRYNAVSKMPGGDRRRRGATQGSAGIPPTRGKVGEVNGMVREFAFDLDRQLEECRLALQNQAQAMLAILAEFEANVKARLEAAEARIETIREYDAANAAPNLASGE